MCFDWIRWFYHVNVWFQKFKIRLFRQSIKQCKSFFIPHFYRNHYKIDQMIYNQSIDVQWWGNVVFTPLKLWNLSVYPPQNKKKTLYIPLNQSYLLHHQNKQTYPIQKKLRLTKKICLYNGLCTINVESCYTSAKKNSNTISLSLYNSATFLNWAFMYCKTICTD